MGLLKRSWGPLLLCAMATACVPDNVRPPETTPARAEVISLAGAQVGSPYKFEGADRHGFDAAGLVYFSFNRAGFEVPRTAEGQLRAAHAISFYDARPADLLFSRLSTGQSGAERGLHVGIYMGHGEMVHAPLSRDEVVLERVDTPYWLQRLVTAARLLP